MNAPQDMSARFPEALARAKEIADGKPLTLEILGKAASEFPSLDKGAHFVEFVGYAELQAK